jgi:hypothetical protein
MAPTKAKLRFDRRHGAIVHALVRKGARHDTLLPGVTVVAVDFVDPACLAAA